jgi:hypothetical protein
MDNILNEDFGEMQRLSNFDFSTHDYEGRPGKFKVLMVLYKQAFS